MANRETALSAWDHRMDGKAATCVRCGAELAPTAHTCAQCGELVASAAPPARLTPSSPLFVTADTQKKFSGDVPLPGANEDELQAPPQTSSEDPRYRTGQRMLGHYTVVRQLGRGGMGTVYLARDDVSGQEVAVKVLPASLARERDIRERFIEEARALAQMDHPNIVPLVTFAQEGEDRFLVMKYLPGESLDARLRRLGVLPPEHARKVLRAVLAGLGYAHARGVVHRDVKPANVIIEGDLEGEHRVFLVDFGIAKKEEGGQHLTQTGMLMGTPQYMSPEQIGGQSIDGRSDLYAAGLVLFEMLAGRPPFDAQKTFQVLRAHVEQPVPDVREARGGPVPEDLVAVVYILLRKDPNERPRDAHEAIGLLDGTGSFPILKPDERLTPSTVSLKRPPGDPHARATTEPPAPPSVPPRGPPSRGDGDGGLNDPSAEELAVVRRRGGALAAAGLFLGAAALTTLALWKPWAGPANPARDGGVAVAVADAEPEPVDRAATLLLIQAARTSLKDGDTGKAFNAIEAAVEQAPQDPDAKSLQVDVRTAAGMLDEADKSLAELKELLAQRPDADVAARVPEQEQALADARDDAARATHEVREAHEAREHVRAPKRLISDASIRKAAASTRSGVRSCYAEHVQARDRSAVGEVTVTVHFKEDGTVAKAQVTASKGRRFGYRSFRRCVEREIRKWRVPPFKGDAPPVPYTISFRPGA